MVLHGVFFLKAVFLAVGVTAPFKARSCFSNIVVSIANYCVIIITERRRSVLLVLWVVNCISVFLFVCLSSRP